MLFEDAAGTENESRSVTLSTRLERAADSRWAELWLSACAFLNSFLIPLPAETLLLPLCIAKPERSWRYASISTVSSILGGLTGYAIGAFAFSIVGSHIVAMSGTTEEFVRLSAQFNDAGAEWILLATISPLPYKLVTITSGVTGLNLTVFLAASFLGRFTGYFLLAGACWKFGNRAKLMMDSSAKKSITVLMLLVAGYFFLFGCASAMEPA